MKRIRLPKISKQDQEDLERKPLNPEDKNFPLDCKVSFAFGDCPFCDKGKPTLEAELKTRKYKNKNITFYEHYYKCDACKQEFTNTDVDEFNVYQVHARYRGDKFIKYVSQKSN